MTVSVAVSEETNSWSKIYFIYLMLIGDHQHCCPQGYTCDVEHSQCVGGNSMKPLTKIDVLGDVKGFS